MRKRQGNGVSLVGAVALGGGLMYLLDPDRGNRRRKMARDQMFHGIHVVEDAADKTVRDLRNRARGTVAELWSNLRREEITGYKLEQRVRSKLGRVVSHPNAIEVHASDGAVTLSGPVLEHELDDLISVVWGVRGVRNLENRLEVHKQPGDVPGLQGGAGRRGERWELLQENWAPATRLIMGTSGALLLAAAPRRSWLGLPLRILGGIGLLRAISNLPLRRAFGVGETRRGIRFQKTIEIDAPVDRVYELWSNPENFPRFMEHVREVKRTNGDRFHWIAAGPAGISASWDAEITEQVPNQVLAWKSVPGAAIRNAGIVRFQDAGGRTRMHVLISYNPPAGVLGHAVAALFGYDPKHAMDDDLMRLKSLLESGKTTAHGEETVAPERQRGKRKA
ncbi:MAG: SRPBCC family protein [Terriglobales bacterium]